MSIGPAYRSAYVPVQELAPVRPASKPPERKVEKAEDKPEPRDPPPPPPRSRPKPEQGRLFDIRA